MVTRRKQHSSQRPVQQGPAVTASRPNKIGASTPYNFRGRARKVLAFPRVSLGAISILARSGTLVRYATL